ncbi:MULTISPECIES: hypothetical protein [unclassified Caballeronia]|uniref:hypothetical protein n=1 Tax=unclassified Caballeronia TaxID=2646786 RepID=UPI001589DCB2|nr:MULTISPECIES: hypothetical protein [unclassified Caballeronia]QSN61200.1 hypothetical protein JYK05_12855 [Caballeronia sp. M1242]
MSIPERVESFIGGGFEKLYPAGEGATCSVPGHLPLCLVPQGFDGFATNCNKTSGAAHKPAYMRTSTV